MPRYETAYQMIALPKELELFYEILLSKSLK